MTVLTSFYLILGLIVAILALTTPGYRFERPYKMQLGAIIILGIINTILSGAEITSNLFIPVSMILDASIIWVCWRWRRLKPNSALIYLILLSASNIVMTITLFFTDIEQRLKNVVDFGTAFNGVWLATLILIAYLSIEYILMDKGLIKGKPVNYFKLARERANHVNSSGQGGRRCPTPR